MVGRWRFRRLSRKVGTLSHGPTGAKGRSSVVMKGKKDVRVVNERPFQRGQSFGAAHPVATFMDSAPVPICLLSLDDHLSCSCSVWVRGLERAVKMACLCFTGSGACAGGLKGWGASHRKAHLLLCLVGEAGSWLGRQPLFLSTWALLSFLTAWWLAFSE